MNELPLPLAVMMFYVMGGAELPTVYEAVKEDGSPVCDGY